MRFNPFILLLLPSLAAADGLRGKVARTLLADSTDAVVYIAEAPGRFPPPDKPADIEQRAQKFVPHVLPILRGTLVRFPNNDRVRHNVFSPAGPHPFNFGIYPPGGVKELKLDELGTIMLLCNIHENMSAYVLVLQNPYFTLVGADGHYSLSGVPAGSYTLSLWAEGKVVATRKITVRGDAEVDFK
jgi:plastocyanin